MKYRPLPPLEELKELLDYNPDTGIFTWKKKCSPRVKIGDEAGCRQRYQRDTRIRISINSKLYLAHRLAYYMHHGADPLNSDLDHIDRNSLNNKISNLRLATRTENARNQKLAKSNNSGKTGVSWHKTEKKWIAHIRINYKLKYLGRFVKKEDAIQARIEAEKKYFGDFRPNAQIDCNFPK